MDKIGGLNFLGCSLLGARRERNKTAYLTGGFVFLLPGEGSSQHHQAA